MQLFDFIMNIWLNNVNVTLKLTLTVCANFFSKTLLPLLLQPQFTAVFRFCIKGLRK